MNATTRRRSRREWQRIVRDWKRSGRSAAEFGEGRKVSPVTLMWWRWRLGKEAAPTPASPPARKAPEFIEVSVVPPSVAVADRHPAAVAIELPGEVVVRVGRGFDEDTLRRVVAILAGGRPC